MKNALLFLPLLSSTSLFAQNGATGREGNFIQTLIMIGIVIVFFYFILWRPEKKRRKALEQQRSSMKKGDQATAMGIVGIVDQIKDNTVILKNIDGSKVEILKMAITEVKPMSAGAEEKKEEKPAEEKKPT